MQRVPRFPLTGLDRRALLGSTGFLSADFGLGLMRRAAAQGAAGTPAADTPTT
jgi:hypothetical protein